MITSKVRSNQIWNKVQPKTAIDREANVGNYVSAVVTFIVDMRPYKSHVGSDVNVVQPLVYELPRDDREIQKSFTN